MKQFMYGKGCDSGVIANKTMRWGGHSMLGYSHHKSKSVCEKTFLAATGCKKTEFRCTHFRHIAIDMPRSRALSGFNSVGFVDDMTFSHTL